MVIKAVMAAFLYMGQIITLELMLFTPNKQLLAQNSFNLEQVVAPNMMQPLPQA